MLINPALYLTKFTDSLHPFRWFHGRISRQVASARLQDLQGEQGVYLVRESETQPGDYAISFLSRTGYIHHFKINSNCGDYFIGGRQFMSLSELIGFYTNCSHILENESLELPVIPPKVCMCVYFLAVSKCAYTCIWFSGTPTYTCRCVYVCNNYSVLLLLEDVILLMLCLVMCRK